LRAADVGVATAPEPLFGDRALELVEDSVELRADGPTFSIWRIG
jgi:hypothetical protein